MRPLTAALLVLSVASGTALAETWSVPGDFASLQAAVDAAGPGDAIQYSDVRVEQVTIAGKTGLTISGKGLLDGANSCLLVTGSSDIVVSGLVFDDAEEDAVRVLGSSDVLFTKCTFQNGEANALYVEDSVRVSLVKCRIHDFAGFGVHMPKTGDTSDDCRIEGNTIYACGVDGIQAPGAVDLVVLRNRIYSCGEDGIAFRADGGAVNARIEGNTLDDLRGAGMVVGGTGAYVLKNKLSRCDYVGIEVHGSGHRIEGNSIRTVGDDGISLVANNCEAVGNKISDIGWFYDGGFETGAGVEAEGSGHLIEANKIKGVRTAGVNILGSILNSVESNSVSGSALHGIIVEGGSNGVNGNKVTKAAGAGFLVDGIGNSLTGNSAKGSGDLDLRDLGLPGDNTYTDNSFGTTNL